MKYGSESFKNFKRKNCSVIVHLTVTVLTGREAGKFERSEWWNPDYYILVGNEGFVPLVGCAHCRRRLGTEMPVGISSSKARRLFESH